MQCRAVVAVIDIELVRLQYTLQNNTYSYY
jgi:hypothetical protein